MADIKLATVIPIGDSIFKESLSYFTTKDIEPGSLVFVPVRKRKIPAILFSLKPIKDAKAEIKNSEFELKKIDKVSDAKFFSGEFIKTAEEMSDYFGTNLGQIISCYSPNNLFKNADKIVKKSKEQKILSTPTEYEDKKHSIELVQAPLEDRIAFYKSLIRETFAKKLSVFLCLPTIHEVNFFSDGLQKGIEDYTVILRPEDSPKKMAVAWQKIKNEDHPFLVIATPIFSCFLDESFGTLIIEKESSPAYKTISRPFVDSRVFLESLSKKMRLRIFIGDTVLRIETMHKKELGQFNPSLLFKYRLINRASVAILDAKNDRNNFDVKAISEGMWSLIEFSIKEKKNILLLTTRKGLSGATICGDCKAIVSCKNCGNTATLLRKEGSNVFFCHKCGVGQSTKVLCNRCRSWNLRPVGFGTEKVEDELREKIKNTKIFRLDGESVKNHKQGKETIDEFEKNKGSILIGTEMALFYLKKPIENIGVISTDTLFFIPDFKINEKIFNFLTNAKMLAEENFVIQTRCKDNPIFDKISRGDTLAFYKEEILSRKNFGYPPFKLFIKITSEGKEETVVKEFDELARFLKKWGPEEFRSSVSLPGGKARMNLLIKINPINWPEKSSNSDDPEKMSLPEILKILPPRFAVKVDAESIL